jgi:hypothetical protein
MFVSKENRERNRVILNHLILKAAQHEGVIGLMNSLLTGQIVTSDEGPADGSNCENGASANRRKVKSFRGRPRMLTAHRDGRVTSHDRMKS